MSYIFILDFGLALKNVETILVLNKFMDKTKARAEVFVIWSDNSYSRLNNGPNIIQVLNPGTCESYFIWQKGFCRCD